MDGYSRPLLRKSPTSSFFLVSTEITGCFSAKAAATWVLMWANCVSRSECTLLGLAVALQTVTCRVEQFGHQSAARLMPPQCSASGSRRTLLPVQRNGELGSPGVVGSTSASRSDISAGSLAIAGLRPAPGRGTRPGASSAPNSFRPGPIVLGAIPVAVATALMSP